MSHLLNEYAMGLANCILSRKRGDAIAEQEAIDRLEDVWAAMNPDEANQAKRLTAAIGQGAVEVEDLWIRSRTGGTIAGRGAAVWSLGDNQQAIQASGSKRSATLPKITVREAIAA